jgi:prolyl-tRNA synthetase
VLGKAREITPDWDPLFFKIDDRDQYKPGYKFNEWELKGVPVRIEIGPRDVESSSVVAVRRDTGEKATMPMEGLRENLVNLLDDIQAEPYLKRQNSGWRTTRRCGQLRGLQSSALKGAASSAVFLDVSNPEVEARLQEETRSTVRCIPFDAPEEEGPCMLTGKLCKNRVIAAQSY